MALYQTTWILPVPFLEYSWSPHLRQLLIKSAFILILENAIREINVGNPRIKHTMV